MPSSNSFKIWFLNCFLVLMVKKMAIKLIKMVLGLVLGIITGMFRVALPPGPLALFSCPEVHIGTNILFVNIPIRRWGYL